MMQYLENRIFTFFLLFMIIVTSFFDSFFYKNFENQFIFFLLPLIWPGFAHGSLDILIAKRIGLIKKKIDHIIFFFVYIFLAISFSVIWSLNSELGFSFFLIISLIHFGMSDSNFLNKNIIYYLDVFVRGTIPLSIPVLMFEQDVFRIFQTLFITDDFIRLILKLLKFNFYILVSLLLFLFFKLKRNKYNYFFEILALVFCFIYFEPLISFSIYFCFFHSLRHLFFEKKKLNFNFYKTFINTVPMTLLSCIFLFISYNLIDLTDSSFEYLSLLFIGLASFTVPHMILISISNSYKP